jgi:hypothetical protein
MASMQAEDARDLELKQELEQAYQDYRHSSETEKAKARAAYLIRLKVFTARVLPR